MPNKESDSIYTFGQFRLSPAKRQLLGPDDQNVPLRGKIYDLLWFLIQHKGRLVSKAELLDALWPDTVVEENNLNQTVSALRQALDDDVKTPELIATVTGRGYQFVGDVTIDPDSAKLDARATQGVPAWTTGYAPKLFLGGVVIVALLIFTSDRFDSSTNPIPEITATAGPPSIAVLPFENRSANDADAFFVDGIHDDILTSLANISSIKVISRTSVEQFKEPGRVIPDIAAELGVSAILEGAVQRAGERVRITVQLIDAATDTHVWAETYDRELTVGNIFAIQSEISNTIAIAMRAELTVQEKDRIDMIPTENLAAYEAYLLGNQRLQRRTGAMIEEARKYFQDAIDLDPGFALAHVGLADSYLILLTYSNKKWSELEPPARAAVEKAIEIDASLGEAYVTLAMINTESGNHEIAGTQFERAISLSPNYATAYHWFASHFFRTGQVQRALEQTRTAARLDPLSPIIRFNLAGYLYQLGQYAEMETHVRKAIEIDPDFARAYWSLAILLHQIHGDLDDAAIFAKRAIDLDPRVPTHYSLLASIYTDMGNDAEASRWLAKAAELDTENVNYVVTAALLAMFRGDEEAAARMLRRYLEMNPRSLSTAMLIVNEYVAVGRFEDALELFRPRFADLLDTGEVVISNRNLLPAISLVNVFQRAAMSDRAQRLLNEIADYVNSSSFRTFPFFLISDVHILVLQGKKAEALAALRQHADSGWRFNTNYHLKYDSILNSIRNEPEFIAIAEDVRSDIAAQSESLNEKWAAEFE